MYLGFLRVKPLSSRFNIIVCPRPDYYVALILYSEKSEDLQDQSLLYEGKLLCSQGDILEVTQNQGLEQEATPLCRLECPLHSSFLSKGDRNGSSYFLIPKESETVRGGKNQLGPVPKARV